MIGTSQHAESDTILKDSKKQLVKDLAITFEFPQYEYQRHKKLIIPMSSRDSNNLRFPSLNDAMKFIYDHCIYHYNTFNKQLAEKQLSNVLIYDPFIDAYIYGSQVPRKEFLTMVKKFSKSSRHF